MLSAAAPSLTSLPSVKKIKKEFEQEHAENAHLRDVPATHRLRFFSSFSKSQMESRKRKCEAPSFPPPPFPPV